MAASSIELKTLLNTEIPSLTVDGIWALDVESENKEV
jgi:hypothetical protein